MVAATARPKTRRATKLKKAAQITAQCGFSTRVETTVAIELAASWKPFMKSKTSATRIRNTTISKLIDMRPGSGILDDDTLDDIGHVLALVGDRLEVLVDLLQLDQLASIGLVAEELRHGRAQDLVRVGLQPVDLAADLHDFLGVAHVVEEIDRRLHFFGAGDADIGKPLRLVGDLADVVEEHTLRYVLHQVEDVVHAGDELVDLVPVDGRDEGRVQELDRLVGDSVRPGLDGLDVVGAALGLARVVHNSFQLDRTLQDERGVLGEIGEEPAFVRHEASEHGAPLDRAVKAAARIVAESGRERTSGERLGDAPAA